MYRIRKIIALLLTLLTLIMSMGADALAAGSPTEGNITEISGEEKTKPQAADPDRPADVKIKTFSARVRKKTSKTRITFRKTIDGVLQDLVFEKNALSKAPKLKRLKVSGRNVTFRKDAFKGCKRLKLIDLRDVEKVTFSKAAFNGISKSKRAQIKIYVSKDMDKTTYKKLVKQLKKLGIKSKNIIRK